MTLKIWQVLAFGLAMPPALATQVAAQGSESAERVAEHRDWSVFVADAPKECYLVSVPTGSVAQREGEPVEVTRGDIRLFVTFRPGEEVANEVSFSGGYPFREGNAVRLEVGSDTFDLASGSGEGQEWAWPASPEEDARLVEMLREGADARITGLSARGTTTIDTFSLMGFTAAIDDARQRCG